MCLPVSCHWFVHGHIGHWCVYTTHLVVDYLDIYNLFSSFIYWHINNISKALNAVCKSLKFSLNYQYFLAQVSANQTNITLFYFSDVKMNKCMVWCQWGSTQVSIMGFSGDKYPQKVWETLLYHICYAFFVLSKNDLCCLVPALFLLCSLVMSSKDGPRLWTVLLKSKNRHWANPGTDRLLFGHNMQGFY